MAAPPGRDNIYIPLSHTSSHSPSREDTAYRPRTAGSESYARGTATTIRRVGADSPYDREYARLEQDEELEENKISPSDEPPQGLHASEHDRLHPAQSGEVYNTRNVSYHDITRSHSGLKVDQLRPDAGVQRNASTRTNATTASGISEFEPEEDDKNLKDPNHKWYQYLLYKRSHKPPVPKDRTICPEYNASFLSLLTWNWMMPLMNKGYQRPLELKDIWLVNPKRSTHLLAAKLKDNWTRRRKQPGKRQLLWALYDTFKFEFILGGVCQLISSCIQILNPFILRYLIQFAAEAYRANIDPANFEPPVLGYGIGLVFVISALQYIQSTCSNQFLYRGMMNGGQARAVLISMIFDKSMSISNRAKAGAGKMPKKPPGLKPGSKEEKNWFKKHVLRQSKPKKPKGKPGPFANAVGWSNGRILNLMSTDSYRVDQASGMFHMIWTAPIAILIGLALLIVNINYSALAGFSLFVIATPLLARAIRSLFRRRRQISQVTDKRVGLTQEILQAIRFVKYFGWEESFLERIEDLRAREISSIQVLLSIRNGINALSMSMPIFASMLAFITYALTDHVLNPALIFSSLALFNSLRIPLNMLPLVLGQVVDAAAAIARIQEFLLEEDAKDESLWAPEQENACEVVAASFTWERNTGDKKKGPGGPQGKQNKAEKKAAKDMQKRRESEFRLDKLRDNEREKTMRQSTHRHSDADREKHDAGSNGSDDSTVIGSQDSNRKAESPMTRSSWDNSSAMSYYARNSVAVPPPPPPPPEEEKPFHIDHLTFAIGRKELIGVIGGVGSGKSSLLAALAGDMRRTEGEVSFGSTRAFCPQYAWIQNTTLRENILFGKEYDRKWYNKVIEACALRTDIDMLPAGDMTEIGERGITVSGGQKQRINIARAIYFNSELVLMDDPLSAVDAHVGRQIMDQAICGLLADKCRVLATHQLWVLNRCDRIMWMNNGQISAFDTFDNLMMYNADFRAYVGTNAEEDKTVEEDEGAKEKKDPKRKGGKRPGGALMQVEERAVNSVSWGVYGAYIRASGSWLVGPLVLFLLIASQGSTIVTSLWLSWWASDRWGLTLGEYVGIYAVLGVGQALLLFIFSIALSFFGTQASKKMLHRAVRRVLHAPMSFFDTTPLGRITNRFSKDIDTMDNVLTDSLRFFMMTMGMIIAVFILIMAYYYFFAVALVPLLIIFVSSAAFYRASGREIKRHEAVLRSVVFSRFSEAINGTATIRAYGLGGRFSKSIRDALDDMNSAYFLTYANQRWLSVRLDIVGILLVFVVGILVVTSRFAVNPSTGGLVLSYILTIVQMIQFTVRQLAEVENNMNATERIHHYGNNLEQEAPPHIRSRELPAEWPQRGEIEFRDVHMRYRDGLPLVLNNFNLHVRAGERIGVVGRTGAGKSSIMSTLFRLVELSQGQILIDGVDIASIGLADLRSRMAIIPQDPTLFKGTIRSNLDPFHQHTDLELWSALRQAYLVNAEMPLSGLHHQAAQSMVRLTDLQRPSTSATNRTTGTVAAAASRLTLDSTVEEEGLNFSLGQRQLMALARALVRSAQIIVCDEATSSVDMETDQKIQRTMAVGFRGKTLLCIAHRLKTIINYDRIIVMDKGSVAEVGTPYDLFMAGGIFASMCERSKITAPDFETSLSDMDIASDAFGGSSFGGSQWSLRHSRGAGSDLGDYAGAFVRTPYMSGVSNMGSGRFLLQ